MVRQAPISTLPQTIRDIRGRLGANTREFAALLGVKHSSVSRYETGKVRPGYLALQRLYGVAEGAEKNVILEALNEATNGEAASHIRTFIDRTEGWASTPEGTAAITQLLHSGFDAAQRNASTPEGIAAITQLLHSRLDAAQRRASHLQAHQPNLEQAISLLSSLSEAGLEIDASLLGIIRLWAEHASSADRNAKDRFVDALNFLQVALLPKKKSE